MKPLTPWQKRKIVKAFLEGDPFWYLASLYGGDARSIEDIIRAAWPKRKRSRKARKP